MDLMMGSQAFKDVDIPLLWGSRAILADKQARLSVIDLHGPAPKLEIIGDEPGPGIEFSPTIDGFEVLDEGAALYTYNRNEKILTSIGLNLPECQISPLGTRIGTIFFSGNVFVGPGVAIKVDEEGMSMGAPLPPDLAKLVI